MTMVPRVSVSISERRPMRPRRGDAELHADAAGAVVGHLGHLALARSEALDDGADEVLGDVDR